MRNAWSFATGGGGNATTSVSSAFWCHWTICQMTRRMTHLPTGRPTYHLTCRGPLRLLGRRSCGAVTLCGVASKRVCHAPPGISASTAIQSGYAGETATLRERAEAAEAARDAAIALADQTVALLKDAVSRADRAEQGRDGERARADALRDRAQAATEAERRADQAEQGREAARKRAHELANRLLVVQGAADRSEELTAQVKAAKAEAREAEDRAEELRLADAARRGRGRWARLRAAWRGE